MSGLHQFLQKLLRLNRAPTKYGKAPHKPVLLLTLLDLMDQGQINQFAPDAELVGIFQENWQLLVDTPHQADFTQPYYYLQSEKVEGEPIWELMPQIPAHIKSVNVLAKVVNYGQLHPELYLYLSDPENRQMVRAQLLQTYFPNTQTKYHQAKRTGQGYFHDLEEWVLNEPTAARKIIKVASEEEVYVRSGLFKRLVPKIYQHTCAITGMRLNSTFGHTYVDACHIVPFSISHDDRVTNGLALCPNLHRVFDRGLITISEDYRVILSEHILEDPEHYYSLTKLKDRSIHLPAAKHTWPDQEMLAWHREHRFAAIQP